VNWKLAYRIKLDAIALKTLFDKTEAIKPVKMTRIGQLSARICRIISIRQLYCGKILNIFQPAIHPLKSFFYEIPGNRQGGADLIFEASNYGLADFADQT
jgi:hypothetical protein